MARRSEASCSDAAGGLRAAERQQNHGGVVDVGIKFVGELEVPAGGLRVGPLHGPVALAAHFLGQQPVGAFAQGVARRFGRLAHGVRRDGAVPDHGKTRLEEEAAAVVDHQRIELLLRFHTIGMFGRVTQQIQRHDDVHHRRIDGGHAVGELGPLQHPLLGFADGSPADRLRAILLPKLQSFVEPQENVVPGEVVAGARVLGMPAFEEKLLQIEPRWNRTARIHSVHDGQRNHDGARPGGHLVDEVSEQDDLGRDGGRVPARIKVEQAQVDLDVAVGRVQATQRQDAFARLRQARMMEIQSRDLEREIRLHGGADVSRALRINIEPAVRQLASQDGFNGLIDQRPRGRIPDAIHGRVQPELQQDVVRFQRGVGGQIGQPITLVLLRPQEKIERAFRRLGRTGQQ